MSAIFTRESREAAEISNIMTDLKFGNILKRGTLLHSVTKCQ